MSKTRKKRTDHVELPDGREDVPERQPGLTSQRDQQKMPTVEDFESMLQRHVIDVWFPRSLDVENGGFLCDFDRTWKPCGPHEKLLEFQARQTLLAAESSRFYPGDERLRQAALHGFRCIRDMMWDDDSGGWFHRLDRAGSPLEAHTKHIHGAAYAIQACVAVHEATGEPTALRHAREGFEWLEVHAHDHQHGGYFGFLKRDGAIIRVASECPWEAARDTIGTPIGFKDLNVHSDLLEAFFYLHRVWPDPGVGDRLAEIVEVLCEKALTPSGALHYFFHPDGECIPEPVHFGNQFQTVYRFLLCSQLVGKAESMRAAARRMMEHALRYGWDQRSGGFFFAGPSEGPTKKEDYDIVMREKSWWVNTEAQKALLSVSQLEDGYSDYLRYFLALSHYFQRYLIDFEHGGMYSTGLDSLPLGDRGLGAAFAPAEFTRKGRDWKDASHEGRAWLHCISSLRKRL
jgi:mannobiose 2-epimerase